MKNKTTIAGIFTLIATIANLVSGLINGHGVDLASTVAGISAGVGLVMAKDSQVTGGSISQPTVSNPPVLIEKK